MSRRLENQVAWVSGAVSGEGETVARLFTKEGAAVASVFLSVKYGIAHLKKNERSYVVKIGSVGSFVGQGSTPAYTASKGAVLQLSKSIALDYAADGVRCSCVCPGITDTPMFREHMNKAPDPQAAIRARLRPVPMGISLTPDDTAKSVLYFSCEHSAGTTGTSLNHRRRLPWRGGVGASRAHLIYG